MAKRLTDNITSSYWEAANRLRPGGRRKRRVMAYVESYDDIFFWRTVLDEFENDEREFQVVLPSRTNLSRGKKQAMANQLGESLGTAMIACVDADLDYLMQGRTQLSQAMLTNPYVFHTYVYAIENYQCYAPSLHAVCVMATLNDRRAFDFERLLTDYSRAVYDLFVWCVWLHRRQRAADFPLAAFGNIAHLDDINIDNPGAALDELRRRANRKVAWMQRQWPEAKATFKPLKAELEQLGMTPDTTYLFIQGHHLFEHVCMPLMTAVCNRLRREREREIKMLGQSSPERQTSNELAAYQHFQCLPEQMMRRSTDFRQAPIYQRLRSDLAHLFPTEKTEAQG